MELELVHGGPQGLSQREFIERERDAEDSRWGLALDRGHVAARLRNAQVQRPGPGRAPDDPGRQDDSGEQGQEQEAPHGISRPPAHGQRMEAVQGEQEEPREIRETGRRERHERHEEARARAPLDLVHERRDGDQAQVEEQDVVPRLLAVPEVVGRRRQDHEGDDPRRSPGEPSCHPVEEDQPEGTKERREEPDLGLAVPDDVHPTSQEDEIERAVRIEDDIRETGAGLTPGDGDGVDLVIPEALPPQREEADRDAGREDAQDGEVLAVGPPRTPGSAVRSRGHGLHLRTSPTSRTSRTTTPG